MTSADTLHALLSRSALIALGRCAEGDDHLVLIGPDEPRFWDQFTRSPEMADGAPDPMDRWSVRVLTAIADAVGGEPLFPFGGPPYRPFQSWAVASGRFWPSPIGFLVHETRGLFVSFRGAIRLPGPPDDTVAEKPCDTCAAPCAAACPVDAFADGYDVASCKAHVASPAGLDCLTGGCLARRACPVGQGLRRPAQAQFHMEAFL